MPQERVGTVRMLGVGVIAAFGFITLSSSITDNSVVTLNEKSHALYEAYGNFYSDNKVYNSSLLSKQAIGDIVSMDQSSDFVQQNKKVSVNLQITKIRKHISSFDFDDEYEEI